MSTTKSKTAQIGQIVNESISTTDKKILEILQTKKESNYKELANELGIDASSIGRRIRKLQDEGLLIKYKKDNKVIVKWIGGIPTIEQELMNATNTHVSASLLAECYDTMTLHAFAVFSLLFEDNYWEIVMNLKEGLTDLELNQRLGNTIPLDSVRRVLTICDTHNLVKLNRIREPAANNLIKLFEPIYRIEEVNKEFFNFMVIIRGLASAMQYRMENKKVPGCSHPFDPLLNLNVGLFMAFKEYLLSKTSVEEQTLLADILLNYDYSDDLDRLHGKDNWRAKIKSSNNINIGSTSNHVLLSDNFVDTAKENMIKRIR